MEFKGKLMTQTGENGKKPNFGAHFGLCPRPPPKKKIFFVGFTSTRSTRPAGPKFEPSNFFIKLGVRQCSKLSSYAV